MIYCVIKSDCEERKFDEFSVAFYYCYVFFRQPNCELYTYLQFIKSHLIDI